MVLVVSESNVAFIVRSSLSSLYVDACLSCRRHHSFLFYSRSMLMEIMGPPTAGETPLLRSAPDTQKIKTVNTKRSETNVANLTDTVDLEQKRQHSYKELKFDIYSRLNTITT